MFLSNRLKTIATAALATLSGVVTTPRGDRRLCLAAMRGALRDLAAPLQAAETFRAVRPMK